MDKGDGSTFETKKTATSSNFDEDDSVSQTTKRKLPQTTMQDHAEDPPILPSGGIVDKEETDISHLPTQLQQSEPTGATFHQEHFSDPPQGKY